MYVHGNPMRSCREHSEIKSPLFIEAISRKGVTIYSSPPLVKLYHMKLHSPDLYNKAKWIVLAVTWILHKLAV